MKAIQMTSKPILCVLVVVWLAATSEPAAAEVYELRAASTTVTMADGREVPMWGFGLTTDLTVSIPGPVLEVPPGDDTLTVHLTNQLPVPVSIVIPGIPAPLTPVWDDGTSGARTNLQQRAVSFTHVAQPGETVTYQWTNVQQGTYLYQSGTHPAVQVSMGLYGAVHHDATAGQAYGVSYDVDQVLLYSEVDPTLNNAVADGTYGSASYPTTIDYRPRYFLVNGQETSSPPELQQIVSQRVLLRVVNAGVRSIVPTLTSGPMSLLAEDGQPAPFVRESYATLLPAGKTRDALLVLSEEGRSVLFDRRNGSLLLRFSALSVAPPVAVADVYEAIEDTSLDTAFAALPGVLANDTGVGLSAVLSSSTNPGTLLLQTDGSLIYTPAPDFNGVDTFRYFASDGLLSSNVVTVAINVSPANDAPQTIDDSYEASRGSTLIVQAPGVLANDSDVDQEVLSAQPVMGPSGGTLTLSADGSFQYTPEPGTTTDSFTYQATDGAEFSNISTVNLTVVEPNAPPTAAGDFALTLRNRAVSINVVRNDSDSDGSIDPRSVVVTNQPTRGGTATSLGNGRVRYAPPRNFTGTDTFTYVVSDNLGAVSAPTIVFVRVIRL